MLMQEWESQVQGLFQNLHSTVVDALGRSGVMEMHNRHSGWSWECCCWCCTSVPAAAMSSASGSTPVWALALTLVQVPAAGIGHTSSIAIAIVMMVVEVCCTHLDVAERANNRVVHNPGLALEVKRWKRKDRSQVKKGQHQDLFQRRHYRDEGN